MTARERLHAAILHYGEARWKLAIMGEVGTDKERASAEAEVATALSTIEREIEATVRGAVEAERVRVEAICENYPDHEATGEKTAAAQEIKSKIRGGK